MNAKACPLVLALAFGLSAHAQVFDPGSDGSMGELLVSTNTTVQLPPDGRLKVRRVHVQKDVTLTFRPNAANTPVYLLSQGDIFVEGTIDVSGESTSPGTTSGGRGGPGGFRGGNRATDSTPTANGHGPGGGRGAAGDAQAGAAGFRTMPNNGRGGQNGPAYGSPVLIPLIGGSGGGGANEHAGGGGGGAILIASATKIRIDGLISSVGGYAPDANGGSGGAVRIVAPTVEGTGRIDVNGREWGSIGRIRIDVFDARYPGFDTPNFVPSTGSLLITGLDMAGAPRLDVLQIGRAVVTPGDQNSVSILLPVGSSPQQQVTVRASNFGRRVPIQVVLTPDSGPRQVFTAEIDNSDPGAAQVLVPVTFPVNVTTVVNVWTAP